MQGEIVLQEPRYDDALKTYFKKLTTMFDKACLTGNGKEQLNFALADYNVLISTAGKALLPICKAFSHLPSVSHANKNALEILVWDEKESGIKQPDFPWQTLDISDLEKTFQISSNNYTVCFAEKKTILHIYNHKQNKAIVCIKDAQKLPNYFLASPFFKIIQLWSKHVGLDLLHAGCIANHQHAVLFVGKGGKGKSTTSIQCLTSGLNYIGDDYLLIKYGDVPMAYSIYCSGKVHAAQMKKFPDIEKVAISRKIDPNDKPLIYLNELFKNNIISKSPVKAIVIPHITLNDETEIIPASSFDALIAMAPSTIIQLRLNNENKALSKMALLTKQVPCYKLNLGAHLNHIGMEIKHLLNKL